MEFPTLMNTTAANAAWAIVATVALLPNTSWAANASPHADQSADMRQPAWDPPLPPWSPRQIEENGSVHVPAFVLPESSLLDERTRAVLGAARAASKLQSESEEHPARCPSWQNADLAAIPAIRRCQAKAFYETASYKELRERFSVRVAGQQLGGVYIEIFTPTEGVAAQNSDRVLINLHGGHFETGSRMHSHLESIPIAALGKIKVISVDYRMAPEYTFPAASEDVAAVYRELLKRYRPKNIGIYGSSAGGLLAAESIAWFDKHGLPLPGAVGMFAAAAAYYQEGDSAQIQAAIEGFPFEPAPEHPYFKETAISDPLAFPIKSPELMSKFPPSLLIASVRDVALSSVVHTHGQLVKLGVEAQLRIWEGLEHCFYYDPALPESREVYDTVVQFFQQHLGKARQD